MNMDPREATLFQPGVLTFSGLQEGHIRVGILPGVEEGLVLQASLIRLILQDEHARQAQMRERGVGPDLMTGQARPTSPAWSLFCQLQSINLVAADVVKQQGRVAWVETHP